MYQLRSFFDRTLPKHIPNNLWRQKITKDSVITGTRMNELLKHNKLKKGTGFNRTKKYLGV